MWGAFEITAGSARDGAEPQELLCGLRQRRGMRDAGMDNINDSKPTVVIADDNPEIVKVVAGLLRLSFTIVAQAADGLKAYEAIREHHPQLAVLDLSMPKMDGFEIASRLSEAKSSTRIVFLTLQSGHDIIEQARRYGHGYVAKLRLSSDLVFALHAALRGEFFASDFA
jgi:CheY-like chemotaxis protein